MNRLYILRVTLCWLESLENQVIGTGWSYEAFSLQIETALVFLLPGGRLKVEGSSQSVGGPRVFVLPLHPQKHYSKCFLQNPTVDVLFGWRGFSKPLGLPMFPSPNNLLYSRKIHPLCTYLALPFLRYFSLVNFQVSKIGNKNAQVAPLLLFIFLSYLFPLVWERREDKRISFHFWAREIMASPYRTPSSTKHKRKYTMLDDYTNAIQWENL